MRQQIGVEHHEPQRDETSDGAEHLLCGEKHDQRQQQCERCHGHVNAKQHCVRVILEQKILAVEKGFSLEEAVLGLRQHKMHPQQRHRSKQFHQRRMFRIQAKVTMSPRAVTAEDVIRLIPCLRFPSY